MKIVHHIISNLHLGIENVMMHKLRSSLTMLGMVFGVASVIAMLSIGEGASKQALSQIRRLGSHNIILSSEKSIENDNQNNQTKRRHTLDYGLTYADFRRLTETFNSIESAVPAKIIRREARSGRRTMTIRLVGTNPQWFTLVHTRLLAGRFLAPDDIQQLHPLAVITETVARELFPANEILGNTVRVGQNLFTIIGIVQDSGNGTSSIRTPGNDNDIYIPISTMRERYGDVDMRLTSGSFNREEVQLHQIIVKIGQLKNVEPTAKAIARMLSTSHKHKDYAMYVPLELLHQARETQRTFSIVLGSIACISLLVGGIGIMNIMLASVTERTREIGVRRAIGARKRQITEQFLTETIVLSSTGGIIGAAVGITVPVIISKLSGMPTVITPWSVVLSLLISIAIGIIFGIYPAIRAASLDPIEALRHE